MYQTKNKTNKQTNKANGAHHRDAGPWQSDDTLQLKDAANCCIWRKEEEAFRGNKEGTRGMDHLSWFVDEKVGRVPGCVPNIQAKDQSHSCDVAYLQEVGCFS